MVNDSLDGKDNLEEKTREVADKLNVSLWLNFLQLGYHMLMLILN